MTKNFVSACLGMLFFAFAACGCGGDSGKAAAAASKDTTMKSAADATASTVPGAADTVNVPANFSGKVPPPAVILGRKQVPILCYHQIRDWKPTDSKMAKDYIMPPATLREQLKMLHDSGYHSILPDQLYAYLTNGAALPSKPIMLTFDDTD